AGRLLGGHYAHPLGRPQPPPAAHPMSEPSGAHRGQPPAPVWSDLPPAVRDHLGAGSLAALWQALRQRLERSGHAVRGALEVSLDDDAADRVAGLLGRPVSAGTVRLRLPELDAALRRSAAGRGVVP